MDNNQLLKRGRFVGLIAIVILIAIVAIQIASSFRFHVVSTEPNINKFSSAVPFFKINFNKNLSASGIKVISSPNIVSQYSASGKTLDLSLTPLMVGKTYTITLQSISSTSDQIITNRVFRFVAKAINPSDLPADQRQAILRNQNNNSAAQNNPIIRHLPYQTLSYSLTGQVFGPEVIISAKIYINESEMTNEAAAVAQIKQEISSYIQSFGLNPNNYNIVYTLVTP